MSDSKSGQPRGNGTTAHLTRRSAAGLGWTTGALAVTTVLQIGYTATISRLLTPAAFGVMAAALLALRFATYFSNFGLASAVIQRRELDDHDRSTAVWLALGLGVGVGGLFVVGAPLAAAIVGMDGATSVIRWMCIGIPLGTVGGVASGFLRRDLRFRASAVISIMSFVAGYLVVGLLAASSGWGVESLVAAHLTQAGLLVLLTMAVVRAPIHLGLRLDRVGSLARFGGSVSATGFLEFLSASIDTLAVGRYAGPAALGQYSRASYLVSLPVENLTTAVSRVLLPGLSRVQDDSRRFSNALLISIGLQAPMILAGTALLIATAPALVPLLLGRGWDQAVTVIPVVGAASAISILLNAPAVAAEAKGLVGLKLIIQAITLAVTVGLVAAVVITEPTLIRLALAWTIGQVVRAVLYWLFVIPRLGLQSRALVIRLGAASAAALAAATPAWVMIRGFGATGFPALAGSTTLGVLMCGAVVLLPFGRPIRADLANVRGRLRSEGAPRRLTEP